MATRALRSASAAVKSVTVMPAVHRPAVSTSTRAGRHPNRLGAATRASAHTAWTAGPSAAPGARPSVAAASGRNPDSAGRSRPAPSRPRPRIRSWTAAVARARYVTSSPTMVTVHPAPNTIAAASGSAAILNSAAGVTFPRPAEPPMMTKSLTRVTSRGSRRTAGAILVSGPVATRVISPAAAPMVSIRKSTACPSRAPDAGGGRRAAPSPDSPWTWRASKTERSSGTGLPATTGTSGQPTKSRTLSALAVVVAKSPLPPAMDMAGIQDRAEQRHRAAGHHGYLGAADEIADAERIGRGCRQVHIPADSGQAQQFQSGMTAREGDGEIGRAHV